VAAYDHQEFPGVVPRTFIGPLALAAATAPAQAFGVPKPFLQVVARLSLAIAVCSGLAHLCLAVTRVFGASVTIWLGVITASQFHFCFYASRTLPNVFALALALHAVAFWLRSKTSRFAVVAAAAVIFFRGELALLFGAMTFYDLLVGRASLTKTVVSGLAAAIVFLPLTVLVDSFFWGRWLWPEGEVLHFNIIQNRSHEWGTQPWHWYFTNCLPR